MRLRSVVLSFILAVCITSGMFAEPMISSDVSDNVIYITAGTSKLIKVDFDIRNMAVGDPKIADALIMSKREILVNGKMPAITTLTLWDEKQHYDYSIVSNKSADNLIFKRYPLHNILLVQHEYDQAGANTLKTTHKSNQETIKDIINILSGYLKSEQYSVSSWMNSILVVATPDDHKRIEELLAQLDVKEKQVLFKVEVYELKLENNLNYGLELLYQKDQSNAEYNKNADGFKYTFTSGADFAEAASHVFKLMLSEGKAKLLATPRILTLNNQFSKIHSGEKYPIVKTDKEGNVTVEYLYSGIVLGVQPTIGKDNEITCFVLTEASSIAGYTQQDKYPIIRSRFTDNQVRVRNDGMIVLGGLIQENENIVTHKLPILGDLLGWVPILGGIVKNEETQKINTEIVVTLRPTVVLDEESPTRLSEVQ